MDEEFWYNSANDTEFAATRHRTLPIIGSITPIVTYPSKLRIFKTNASRYWQVRCYFTGKTYTQSLRTTNKQSAISLAKQFFHVKTAELYGETVKVKDDTVKFADVVGAFVTTNHCRRAMSRYNSIKYLAQKNKKIMQNDSTIVTNA